MLRRLVFRLILATALVGAVTISGAVVSGAAGTRDVKVTNFQFGDGSPEGNIAKIDQGETVVWHVEEGEHQITPDDPSYFQGSDPLTAPVDWESAPFNTPGDYPYHCNIHSTMTGVVRVAPLQTSTTTLPPTTTTTTAPPTTTTTRPPTTTTTAHGPTTTTTLPPSTTPTTTAPGTPTTTPPTVGVAAPPSTSPTTAGPAPTTTTGKSKSRPAKTTGPAKAAGKNGKDGGNKTDEPPAAPGDEPPADVPPGELPALGTGEGGATDFEAQEAAPETNGEQAASAAEHEPRHGMLLLLGTGAFVTLLGLGALGYKWRTRDSQYWTA